MRTALTSYLFLPLLAALPPPPSDGNFNHRELSCDLVKDPASKGAADDQAILVWSGGGSGGLGNHLLSFLTAFYDAMRTGRRIMRVTIPTFSFTDLNLAFDMSGIPPLPRELELGMNSSAFNRTPHATTRTTSGRAQFSMVHVQRWQHDGISSASQIDGISYRFQQKYVAARRDFVVQSRYHNVHLDRPKQLPCYRVIGCPEDSPQKQTINVNKQEDNPLNFCGETWILQHFIVGLSPRLLAVRAVFEQHWQGSTARLAALLDYRSPFAPEVQALDKADRKGSLPVFDVAVHCRVGFTFVEQGSSENEGRNGDVVRSWIARVGESGALKGLAEDVRGTCQSQVWAHRRRVCVVYVASETALVREYLAKVITASGPLHSSSSSSSSSSIGSEWAASHGTVEVDFSSFAGHAHPVDLNNDHRVIGDGKEYYERLRRMDAEMIADLCSPFLEWWALAHSRRILVRRGEALRAASSTFSGTAHLYGGWISANI